MNVNSIPNIYIICLNNKNMEYTDAGKYENLRHDEQLQKTRIIFRELGDKKTLDVGCGTGISSSLFTDVTGIDPSEELLSKNPYPHVKGKAENLPFQEKEFDNVIAITSIHNFGNIEKGLIEMKRVGRNFGFSILNRSSKFNQIVELIHKHFKIEKEIDEGTDTIFICR